MDGKSKDRFAVILQEWETKAGIPDLANALVKTTGLLFADALILAGKTRGIIGRGLEEKKAEELISRAKELGADAFTVPENRLVKVPKVLNTTKLACSPESLFISLNPGNIVYSVDWKNIISISCGFVRQVTEIKKNWQKIFFDLLDTHLPYGPAGLVVAPIAIFEKWADETYPKEKVEYPLLMDIVTKDPVARFRVESHHFAYCTLGSKKKLSTLDNFKELLREVTVYAPQTLVGGTVKTLLGEKESEKTSFKSLYEFDCYNTWLIQKAFHQPKQLLAIKSVK